MSIYTISSETEMTAPVDADELVIALAPGGTIYKIALDTLRAHMHSGIVNATAATLTVTKDLHSGQTVTLNRAGGVAVTLPAATGTGCVYRFVVGTTFTTDGTIKVVGDDTMIGTAILFADAGDTTVGFAASGTDDTITLDGADTGGILGCEITLTDIAADLWHVAMVSDATGTEATPFSATVS